MFRWTKARSARLAEAVRAYNAAITREAKKLEAAGRPDLAARLPERASVAAIRAEIHDVNDFRRIVGYRSDLKRGRTSRLTRILRSVRPDAMRFVTDDSGAPITVYEKREYRYDRAAITRIQRRNRKAMESKLAEGDEAVGLGGLSSPGYGAATVNTDLIGGDEGEYDSSYDEAIPPETLDGWRREDARKQRARDSVSSIYDEYLGTWRNPNYLHDVRPGYEELIRCVTALYESNPLYLMKLFNSGAPEVDPGYLIPSDTKYAGIDFDSRHRRAVAYWKEKARGYVS